MLTADSVVMVLDDQGDGLAGVLGDLGFEPRRPCHEVLLARLFSSTFHSGVFRSLVDWEPDFGVELGNLAGWILSL